MMEKLKLMEDMIIDGHAPNVTGKELNSYLLEHIKTDHECTNVDELNEKVGRGMYEHNAYLVYQSQDTMQLLE